MSQIIDIQIELFPDDRFHLECTGPLELDEKATLRKAFNCIATVYRQQRDQEFDKRQYAERDRRAKLPWIKRTILNKWQPLLNSKLEVIK